MLLRVEKSDYLRLAFIKGSFIHWFLFFVFAVLQFLKRYDLSTQTAPHTQTETTHIRRLQHSKPSSLIQLEHSSNDQLDHIDLHR